MAKILYRTRGMNSGVGFSPEIEDVSQATLLIRADANVAIGTGHVMRCLALAQAWQDAGGKAVFAMEQVSPSIGERLQKESIGISEICAPAGTGEDAKNTVAIARECGASWIAVDGYRFGSDYQKALKADGVKALFLDDYCQDGPYSADVVLNQNISAEEYAYREREPHTRLLLGAKYCLLRREFAPWREWKREIIPFARRVLVTMGGSDPGNFTEKVIHAIAAMDCNDLEAAIVVGGSNPRAEALLELAEKSGKKMKLHRDISDMAELMSWADVAISAAGTTCWELCLLGLPSILVDLADNQTAIAQGLDRRGCAIHVGRSDDVTPLKLAEALQRLLDCKENRKNMSRRCRQLVDARGASRVVSVLLGEEIRLRPAEERDIRLLWEWANDAQVRAAAFSTETIPWEIHAAWFATKLSDPDCRILISEEGNGRPIGQFRTDRRTGGDADISVSLSREFRGKGYGGRLIEEGVAAAFAEGGVTQLHAFVKPDNLASRRSFEWAGFENLGEERVKGTAAIHYIRVKDARVE